MSIAAYLPRDRYAALLRSEDLPQHTSGAALFADISGFTRMSEGMEPLVLAGILNRTFEAMTDTIFSRGGTLDKYIGDAIMAVFGAPVPKPDDAVNAVRAAVKMRRALDDGDVKKYLQCPVRQSGFQRMV